MKKLVLKSHDINCKICNVHDYCVSDELCELLDDTEKKSLLIFRNNNDNSQITRYIIEEQLKKNNVSLNTTKTIIKNQHFHKNNDILLIIGTEPVEVLFRYSFQDLKMGKIFKICIDDGDILLFGNNNVNKSSDDIEIKQAYSFLPCP